MNIHRCFWVVFAVGFVVPVASFAQDSAKVERAFTIAAPAPVPIPDTVKSPAPATAHIDTTSCLKVASHRLSTTEVALLLQRKNIHLREYFIVEELSTAYGGRDSSRFYYCDYENDSAWYSFDIGYSWATPYVYNNASKYTGIRALIVTGDRYCSYGRFARDCEHGLAIFLFDNGIWQVIDTTIGTVDDAWGFEEAGKEYFAVCQQNVTIDRYHSPYDWWLYLSPVSTKGSRIHGFKREPPCQAFFPPAIYSFMSGKLKKVSIYKRPPSEP